MVVSRWIPSFFVERDSPFIDVSIEAPVVDVYVEATEKIGAATQVVALVPVLDVSGNLDATVVTQDVSVPTSATQDVVIPREDSRCCYPPGSYYSYSVVTILITFFFIFLGIDSFSQFTLCHFHYFFKHF
ncbi:unnamed protein product [Cuscuta epithymum]|uniref:Uncharacterized protein n=1 Tax=Cuscuta epithymum TaxID=186058 RepID=A0AAV0CYH0_9ASTE|nr:unnamed protein product [Cuscuta epithymum]